MLTTVNRAAGEAGHHWPHVLPDGRYALYTAELDGESYSEARIMLLSLETGQSQLLIDGGSDARYIPTGHIVYWHSGAIWSVPFDLSSRRLGGAAVVVLPDVMLAEANGHAHFAVAADGTVAYLSGADPNGERGVMLVDRTGTARPVTTERKAYRDVRVSPEGTRLGMNVIAANDSLWTLDLDRGAPTRITFEAENSGPVWSPDGTGFAFTRNFGGEPAQLHLVPSDGSGTPRLIRPSDRPEFADSWSRTGNLLAFTREESATGPDIWVMPMEANAKALPWLATRFDESAANFSPDGRWIAYVSNQSGRFEVYVRSYPGGAHNRQVSFEGGTDPRWRGDGRELFYRHQDSVLVGRDDRWRRTAVLASPRSVQGPVPHRKLGRLTQWSGVCLHQGFRPAAHRSHAGPALVRGDETTEIAAEPFSLGRAARPARGFQYHPASLRSRQ